MDAALRGSLSLFSKKAAKGSSSIEKRQEKIKGERMSFAMMTRYPKAMRLTSTHIVFT